MGNAEASRFIRVIVPGALNTDIIAIGVPYLPGDGEDVYARELRITAGGKARNIAEMIAVLTTPGTVAMISRTTRDPFGLWQPPVEALKAAGVNTDYVLAADPGPGAGQLPGIALVTVDPVGRRTASIFNGVLADFSVTEIDRARPLFEATARNGGFLVLTLEVPLTTAAYAISQATSLGIKVILDPGGLRPDATPSELAELFRQPIYLIKPNEHEARLLSGIEVTGLESARRAAAVLRGKGAQNVLITHGARGGYLIGDGNADEVTAEHIPVPAHAATAQADATGCGDQVTAALCARLSDGATLPSAARFSIAAGTAQFSRIGVQPLTRADLPD